MSGDREPQAGAAASLGTKPGSIDLVEPFEDPVARRGGHADAVILDRRDDVIAVHERAHRDVSSFRAELDRVVDEVDDDLPKPRCVAADPRQIVGYRDD